MGLLRVGDPAPEFTAVLSTGERVSLHDYRAKQNVVLFFYPRDESPGCTAQVCSFRDHYGEVRRLGAVMLGVSEDGNASHMAFIARRQLPFPLIADTDGSLSKLYGAARLGGFLHFARRVTYVIDREGTICGVIHHELRIEAHIRDIVAILQGL